MRHVPDKRKVIMTTTPMPYAFIGDGENPILELLRRHLVETQNPKIVDCLDVDGSAFITAIGDEPGAAGWLFGILRWDAVWGGDPWPEAVNYHLDTPMVAASRYVPEAGELILVFPAPKLSAPTAAE